MECSRSRIGQVHRVTDRRGTHHGGTPACSRTRTDDSHYSPRCDHWSPVQIPANLLTMTNSLFGQTNTVVTLPEVHALLYGQFAHGTDRPEVLPNPCHERRRNASEEGDQPAFHGRADALNAPVPPFC